MQKNKNAAQKHSSLVGTLVFCSIILCLIAAYTVGMVFLSNSLQSKLENYELSQAATKSQQVFSLLFREPDWKHIYSLAEQTGEQPFTAEEYAAYMDRHFADGPLTLREAASDVYGIKRYVVLSDNRKAAAFTICSNQPYGKTPNWQLGNVEIFCSADLDVTVIASAECTVSVDGNPLGNGSVRRCTITGAEAYLPVGLHGSRINEYHVGGLWEEPAVEVLDAQGNPVELTYDSQTRTYTQIIAAPEPTEEQTRQLTEAAEAYGKYMAGAINTLGLRKHFNSRTEVYASLAAMDIPTQKDPAFEAGEVLISDFYAYGDRLYSAKVRMDFTVEQDGETLTRTLDNTIFMETTDGEQWLVTEMLNTNVQDPVTQVRLTYAFNGAIVDSQLTDVETTTLTPPEVEAPEGKTFQGWFTCSEDGSTMELAFLPGGDGTVKLAPGTLQEPMVLYALFA